MQIGEPTHEVYIEPLSQPQEIRHPSERPERPAPPYPTPAPIPEPEPESEPVPA